VIVLERRKSEASKFRDFEKAGDLTIVDVPGQDITELGDYVERVEASGVLDRIGVDQAGIGAVVDEIVDRKIDFERIVGIPQGWRLVGAIKTAERKLAAGQLKHGSQGVMAYSVANAKVEPRGNAVMITKQTAGAAKIDPLMALFDAVALMAMNPQPRKKLHQLIFV
jgi:phage terminase large subunit-like protein